MCVCVRKAQGPLMQPRWSQSIWILIKPFTFVLALSPSLCGKRPALLLLQGFLFLQSYDSAHCCGRTEEVWAVSEGASQWTGSRLMTGSL